MLFQVVQYNILQTKAIVDFQQEIRVSANLQGVFWQDNYFVNQNQKNLTVWMYYKLLVEAICFDLVTFPPNVGRQLS